MTGSEYLTAEEAALEVQFAPAWVRRQCNAKNIVATKVGRQWRIARKDLESFMRKYRGSEGPSAQPRESTVTRHRRSAR